MAGRWIAVLAALLSGTTSCSSTSTNEPNSTGGNSAGGTAGASTGGGSSGGAGGSTSGGAGGGGGACSKCYDALYSCEQPCPGTSKDLYDKVIDCVCGPQGKCKGVCDANECNFPCSVKTGGACDNCVFSECGTPAAVCESDKS